MKFKTLNISKYHNIISKINNTVIIEENIHIKLNEVELLDWVFCILYIVIGIGLIRYGYGLYDEQEQSINFINLSFLKIISLNNKGYYYMSRGIRINHIR